MLSPIFHHYSVHPARFQLQLTNTRVYGGSHRETQPIVIARLHEEDSISLIGLGAVIQSQYRSLLTLPASMDWRIEICSRRSQP
jgi:hypothetical protein